MKARIWCNGRMSWLWVALLVYATVCVLAFDYAWRVIQAPFELLVAGAAVLWLGGSVALILIGRRARRPN